MCRRGGGSAHPTIWKGFDPGLNGEVALKQLSGSGAAAAARREAAALAGLRHPNILAAYDGLEDADRCTSRLLRWWTVQG
jgi:serine/threonine protein kinase